MGAVGDGQPAATDRRPSETAFGSGKTKRRLWPEQGVITQGELGKARDESGRWASSGVLEAEEKGGGHGESPAATLGAQPARGQHRIQWD